MADCVLNPTQYSDFATKDLQRLVGKFGESLARKGVFPNILAGGTLENVSDEVRSVIQEQAVLAGSLVNPSFAADINMCGHIPPADQVGTTEYVYRLETLRGRGPRVCVRTTRTAFKGSYMQAQLALERGILKLINADIRAQLYIRSGLKMSINASYGFSAMLAGGAQQINVLFPNITPNAMITFQTLWKLASHLRENLLVDPFDGNGGQGSNVEPNYRFIGSVDAMDVFRNELGIREDMRSFVTGKYQIGTEAISGYTWKGPYRGISFGIDSQPLRCNSFVNGQPVLIEPEVGVSSTRGVAARINPTWASALYEIGFLIGADSFKRLTPQQWTGEGTFKFAPQMWMGELEWRYIIDNDCNLFGDFGQHIYQIMRAYQPLRPHAIVPIVYQRCPTSLGLTAGCTSSSGL